MISVLRQSGNLASISKSVLRSTTKRSLRPSLSSASRYYATNDPKDPKENDKNAVDPPSKNAPGSEHIYNGAKSPLTPPLSDPKKDGGSIAPGMVRLTAEDEAALDALLATIKNQSGPFTGQVDLIEKTFATIKKEGMPKELLEIVHKLKAKEKISLSDAIKLTRITSKYASDFATRQAKADQTDFQSNAPNTESTGGSQKDGKKDNGPKDDKKETFEGFPPLDTSTLLTAALAAYLTYEVLFSPGDSSRDITWQEFRTTFFDKGLVEKLSVEGGHRVRVDLHRDLVRQMYPESPAINPSFHYYFTIGSVEAFERRLDDAQQELGIPSSERIPVTYVKGGSTFFELLIAFGPPVLLLGALFALTRRAASGSSGGAGGIFSMGKSRAKRFNHDAEVKVKFKDVAGMDEAKQEIMEFVAFLKTPEQFQRLGAKIPRGAILSGPPGTGKTLLAKATAGESGVPFFSVSGSEFVEMFVGVGASRVRDLFSTARKNTPCIIFIDEIDAIGKSRSKNNFGGGNDEREATLNQILTEMDGFNTSEQVVVLAGTNRADVLDKALMRPGRFDRHIAIDRPTMEGRRQIFKVHLRKIVTHENIENLTGRLSALTPGFSGADIANCVNEAALIAARSSATSVAQIHFEQAIERVVGGLERKSLVLKPEEKRTVAYHEAGHAICGWYFKYADPLLKVSIIPRGQGALGYAQYLPDGDTYLLNVDQLMDRMAMTLGGRISEELHFDTVTSGASDDFRKVTSLATAMVTKWGMSEKMGTLSFPEHEDRMNKPFAEVTAQTIDAEVRRIVDEAYKKCKDLLVEKKAQVGIVAEELLAKEVLGREDMIRLLGPRPFEDNKEFSKYFGGDMSAPPPPPTEEGPIIPTPGSEVA